MPSKISCFQKFMNFFRYFLSILSSNSQFVTKKIQVKPYSKLHVEKL